MSATSGIVVGMDSGMVTACKGKPAEVAVPGNNRSERFLTPRWGASRFGLGTQGGARDAGLPWAGMLRTVGAAQSGPEIVQTPGDGGYFDCGFGE